MPTLNFNGLVISQPRCILRTPCKRHFATHSTCPGTGTFSLRANKFISVISILKISPLPPPRLSHSTLSLAFAFRSFVISHVTRGSVPRSFYLDTCMCTRRDRRAIDVLFSSLEETCPPRRQAEKIRRPRTQDERRSAARDFEFARVRKFRS